MADLMALMDDFREIIRRARSQFKGFDKSLNEAQALARWPIAVGASIAKYARAVTLKKGILWVEVSHPIWRSELNHRKAQILSILNETSSVIKDIFFVDPRVDRTPRSREGSVQSPDPFDKKHHEDRK